MDEILFAGLANQRESEILSGNYLMQIADRSALPAHTALIYWGDFFGKGTTQVKIPVVGLLGYDLPQAIAEAIDAPNTPLTDTSFTLSVGGYAKAYEAGDVARFTDPLGTLKTDVMAQDAVVAGAMRQTNLIANVADDFTQVVGSSGVDLTLAQFVSGVNLLEINTQAELAPGDCLSVLHPVQLGDLRTAMLTVAGSAQYIQATAEMLQIRGAGYRGMLFGVDLFSSSQVPTANAAADRAGSIFTRGAIVWADMSVDANNDANTLVLAGKVLFEKERKPRKRTTTHHSSQYLGASKGIDLCGVGVTSDA